jgi:hypothetical protein
MVTRSDADAQRQIESIMTRSDKAINSEKIFP